MLKVNLEALQKFNDRLTNKTVSSNAPTAVTSKLKASRSTMSFDSMDMIAQEKAAEKAAALQRITESKEQQARQAKLEQLRHKNEAKKKFNDECEAKTKRYFDNTKTRFGMKAIENGTVYYGDQLVQNRCWLANGIGEFSVKGNIVYSGPFMNHSLHGRNGQLTLSDYDETISGSFVANQPHGLCQTKAALNRMALYDHGFRVCYLDELVEGTQIIINNVDVGIIISDVTSYDEEAKILVKMNEQLQVVNLRVIDANFRICRNVSPIFHIVNTSELNSLRLTGPLTSNHRENFFSELGDEIQARDERMKRNEELSKGREEVARKKAEDKAKLKSQQAKEQEAQLLTEGMKDLSTLRSSEAL